MPQLVAGKNSTSWLHSPHLQAWHHGARDVRRVAQDAREPPPQLLQGREPVADCDLLPMQERLTWPYLMTVRPVSMSHLHMFLNSKAHDIELRPCRSLGTDIYSPHLHRWEPGLVVLQGCWHYCPPWTNR